MEIILVGLFEVITEMIGCISMCDGSSSLYARSPTRLLTEKEKGP